MGSHGVVRKHEQCRMVFDLFDVGSDCFPILGSDAKAFTSRYDSWQYLGDLPVLPKTLSVLEKTVDMRIPLTFTLEDTALIASILSEEITMMTKGNKATA